MFSVALRAVEHDLGRAELVAPVHDRHLRGELGEEDRLLHRGVAAADDDRLALLEERRVAGRAVGDAAAVAELLLAGHAELLVLRAHREDHRARLVVLVVDPHRVQAALLGRRLHAGRVVGQEARAEALGLVAHRLHELGAHDPVAEAGVVLDLGGLLQQAAPEEALDDQRREVGARGVQRGRVARGSAADDDDLLDVLSHWFSVPGFSYFSLYSVARRAAQAVADAAFRSSSGPRCYGAGSTRSRPAAAAARR